MLYFVSLKLQFFAKVAITFSKSLNQIDEYNSKVAYNC